jgi:hypothetical protein
MSNLSDEVSQEQASIDYALSPRTIRRYKLPHRRKGRQVLYKRRDLEEAIAQRAGSDRNTDQHLTALSHVGGEKPTKNLFREISYMVADRVLSAVETLVGRDANSLDWHAEYGIDPDHAAIVLARAAVIARHAGGWYLSTGLDQDFRQECGQSMDELLAAMTGVTIKTKPTAANVFTGREFAEDFEPLAARAAAALAKREAKR